MKVLHVVGPAAVGGLERVVQSLAIAQQEAGHSVTVAAILDEPADDHPFLAPLERVGVGVRTVVVPGRAYRRENRGVARLCAELKPDVDLTELDLKRSVSRRHARIVDSDDGLVVIEEVGALNGTFVNGTRLTAGEPHAIEDGDRLGFGMVKLLFHT